MTTTAGPVTLVRILDHSTSTTSGSRLVPASTLATWAGLLTLYFVWGSTYLGIRISVVSIPPFLMAGARFLIAGLLLLAWVALRDGRDAMRLDRRQLRDSFVVGAALLGGGMGMVAFGEQTVPAGITALLIALMPVWVAIFGRMLFGERLTRFVAAGIAIGLVGVAILVAPTGGGLAFVPIGLAAVLISPISWGLGSLYASHRARLPGHPLVAAAVQMIFGGIVLSAAAAATGELGGFSIAAVTSDAWWAFIYLVTIGSLVGYTTYGWLLRVAPLPKIATYAYVNPVVAFILGAILLGEELSVRTIVAAAVIVTAVAIIVTARGRAGLDTHGGSELAADDAPVPSEPVGPPSGGRRPGGRPTGRPGAAPAPGSTAEA
jgi:drug/metabolite transporter (DMT)-like permease